MERNQREQVTKREEAAPDEVMKVGGNRRKVERRGVVGGSDRSIEKQEFNLVLFLPPLARGGYAYPPPATEIVLPGRKRRRLPIAAQFGSPLAGAQRRRLEPSHLSPVRSHDYPD